MAPSQLTPRLQSLPPMLHMFSKNPIASYSKGSRGLFVLSRVGGIFTATTISPGPSSRQRSSRYTIRAGRNLPAKEFRSHSPQLSLWCGPSLHLVPRPFLIWNSLLRFPVFIFKAMSTIFRRPSDVRCSPLLILSIIRRNRM
jgi:hypothetical protein